MAPIAVVAALVVAQMAVLGLIPTVPAARNLGEVGAAYGVAALLISGFALVASTLRQSRQIRMQREQLAAQRAELNEQKRLLVAQTEALAATSRAQTDAAGSLQGQLSHMSARGRLDDYNRRLERFVELQAGLDEETLDVDLGADISQQEARDRLGHRYLATLTILLSELERLRDDPILSRQAEALRGELETILRRDKVILYLALVPPPSRLPREYAPSELGRLVAVHRLFPFVRLKDATGRAAVYEEHFWPLRQGGA